MQYSGGKWRDYYYDKYEVAKFCKLRQFGEKVQKQYQKYIPLVICLFVISDSSFGVGARFILILCLLQAAETRVTQSKHNGDNKVGLN